MERMNEMVSKVEAFNPYTDEEEKKEGMSPGEERYGRHTNHIRIKDNEERKTGPSNTIMNNIIHADNNSNLFNHNDLTNNGSALERTFP
jgi:hypothetical protein